MKILEKIHIESVGIFHNFTITLGDCTFIQGMPGTGKTTLLKIINGILDKKKLTARFFSTDTIGRIDYYFNIENCPLDNPITLDFSTLELKSQNSIINLQSLNEIIKIKSYNEENYRTIENDERYLSWGQRTEKRLHEFLVPSSKTIILIDDLPNFINSENLKNRLNELKSDNQIIITSPTPLESLNDIFDVKQKLLPIYEDHLFQISLNPKFYTDFKKNLENIKKLNSNSELIIEDLRKILNKMSYANIITIMETFLTNAVIFLLEQDKSNEIYKNILSTITELGNTKITLSQIFDEYNSIRDRIKSYLLNDIVFHNIPRIRPVFEKALKIPFPSSVGQIIRAVEIRHDIVHRNGKTIDGHEIELTKTQIEELIQLVEDFVDAIHKKIKEIY
jgi:energy-coupling factor transporter ATP-binding protein EcfA2